MKFKDLIKKLQLKLNEAGEKLSVDGDPGPKTQRALDNFEVDLILSKIEKVETPVFSGETPINFEKFKIALKSNLKEFKSKQWDGFVFITKKFYELGHKDLRWLAYILATALHETAHTMLPVTEYGSKAYLRGKKYWPFIGRGYVQLTHDYNYQKYGIKDTPEKALEPEFAAFVLIDGMVKGTFTRKKLPDYFNDSKDDAYNARRIVNGIDKANPIHKYHRDILKALNESLA